MDNSINAMGIYEKIDWRASVANFKIKIKKERRSKPRCVTPYTQDSAVDSKAWLFDGEECKIGQAERQGADYLICRIPMDQGEKFAKFVKTVFSDFHPISSNLAESSDFGRSLSGVLLFNEGGILNRDEYLVVNNKNVAPKINTDWFKERIGGGWISNAS